MEHLEYTEEQEKMFIKGFNGGYLVAKHDPDLAATLIKENNSGSEYFEGILSGKEEFEMEMIREQFRSKNQNDTPSRDKDIDKER